MKIDECMRGHSYTEANTYLEKRNDRIKRRCRKCNANRAKLIRSGKKGLPVIEKSFEKDFLRRIKKTPTCWLWIGSVGSNGYGKISINYKTKLAHRVSYEMFKGIIPENKQLDHLCRIRHCVNPNHLDAVSAKQNVFRGVGITSKNKLKIECLRGHRFDKENTSFTQDGKRVCKQCACIRQKVYYLKSNVHRYVPCTTEITPGATI